MFIKIDTREKDLFDKINHLVKTIPNFNKCIIQSETLDIGDIIIADEKEEKIIIERKTIADLLSSIKDCRYEEQSYRLNGLTHHNHNIVYLIEGDLNKISHFKTNETAKFTALSAMFSLNYYKGFSVQRSISLEETALMICNMAYKLDKSPSKKAFYENLTNDGTNDTNNTNNNTNENLTNETSVKQYVNVIKKVKKENITPENISEIMLCQIPGISSVTALAVMSEYKSIANLIKELENNNECLKDIKLINTTGQIRKINKTCVENIVKFLLKK
jgi:ERCC4-type nuclease